MEFEKQEDEELRNGKPYCLKCGEPRFWESPDRKILVRCLCKCQNEEYERLERIYRKEQKLERFLKLQELSIMGDRFENSYFANLDMSRPNDFIFAVNTLKKYVNDFLNGKMKNVFIYGNVGLGKTELVSCVANEIMRHNIPVLITNFMEIIKYITSSFKDDDLENQEYIENLLININLLIIDDFGTEYIKKENAFAHDLVYNIINGRYIRNKPIIFTSNNTSEELREKYAEKIIDRLSEIKLKIKLENGESYRKTKFLKNN